MVDQSIISDVGSNVAHARIIRALASFVRVGGIVSVGDLQVTGDPVDLAINCQSGIAFVPMGTRQGFEPFIVDVTEKRSLASAVASRVDLAYAGVQSKEFGDAVNHKDIFVKTGPNGGTSIPLPDPMAGILNVAKIAVPVGATKGTDCTITMLAQTTTPKRDGGFTAADIAIDDRDYCLVVRNATQTVGSANITAGTFDTTAWTQVNWDTILRSVAPAGLDMPDLAHNQMLVPTDGYYSGQVVVSFPAQVPPVGLRGLRVRTIFGSLVAQTIVAADNFAYLPARLSCAYEVPADAGHHLIAEVLHTAGSNQVMPKHAGYNATAWSQNRAVNGT